MEVPTSSVPSLEVFLLGRFAVRVAGKDVDLEATPGRKARMLLKLLALQRNHQIIRDQAVDLLWPDLDLKSGANQEHVHYTPRNFATRLWHSLVGKGAPEKIKNIPPTLREERISVVQAVLQKE